MGKKTLTVIWHKNVLRSLMSFLRYLSDVLRNINTKWAQTEDSRIKISSPCCQVGQFDTGLFPLNPDC